MRQAMTLDRAFDTLGPLSYHQLEREATTEQDTERSRAAQFALHYGEGWRSTVSARTFRRR